MEMNKDLKILVVDDFSTMRAVLNTLLQEMGFSRIHEADSGVRALKKLKTENYDFLITDCNMPEMSGLELLRTIRHDEKLARLPVLLVTAEAKRDQILEAVKAGANGYILKPFTLPILKEKIEKIFKGKRDPIV